MVVTVVLERFVSWDGTRPRIVGGLLTMGFVKSPWSCGRAATREVCEVTSRWPVLKEGWIVMTLFESHIAKLQLVRWVYSHWTPSPYQLAFQGEFYPSGCNIFKSLFHKLLKM